MRTSKHFSLSSLTVTLFLQNRSLPCALALTLPSQNARSLSPELTAAPDVPPAPVTGMRDHFFLRVSSRSSLTIFNVHSIVRAFLVEEAKIVKKVMKNQAAKK